MDAENTAEDGFDDSDSAVAISELAEQLAAGKQITVDEACRLYPEAEDTIRRLWGILVISHAVSQNFTDSLAKDSGGDPKEPSASAPSAKTPSPLYPFPLSQTEVGDRELAKGDFLPRDFGEFRLLDVSAKAAWALFIRPNKSLLIELLR